MYHAHGRKTVYAVAGKPDAVKAACPVWRGAHGTGPSTRWHLAGCLPDGDIAQCFDSIPHGVILNCLRKRIKDERFIDLIGQMLQAGVMEEGTLLPTYSGTPQGGLASPVLSNIVLHELDCWLEDHWGANPPALTRKPQYARTTTEYARHKRNLVRWRAQLAGRIPMGRQTPEGLRAKIKQTLAARSQIPSVHPRRMISYCRYADDVRHVTQDEILLAEKGGSEDNDLRVTLLT